MRSIRIALSVILAGLVAAPAYADDPVVNYVRVSVDSDQKLGCNDLNVEIGNVNRDIGLLESQDEELQGVASQGVQTFVPQSSNAGNVFEALGNTLGDAAVIDAEDSIPAVEASLSTARARVGYLQTLEGSCGNNNGQQQVQQQPAPQQQPPPQQQVPQYSGANNTGGFLVNQLSSKCIDVVGGPGTENGAILDLWNCETGVDPSGRQTDQKWEITKSGFIRSTLSGRCIDVVGGPGTQNGARLDLWDCEVGIPNTDQQWTITKQGFIKNKLSGKCIDVEGTPGVAAGAALELYDCETSGHDAFAHAMTDQKWTLRK